MGDEDDGPPTYVYEGARAEGETVSVTAGETPKVLTKPVVLLGARKGLGTATFKNGDKYSGNFEAGFRSGNGTYIYAAPAPEAGHDPKPPIATYEGQFQEGVKDGLGTVTYASGHKYRGNFRAGKFEGQGTMFYPNGDIFTGAWAEGKKHGAGNYLYKASNTRLEGAWVRNVLTEGTFTDQFGGAYTGSFAANASSARYIAGGTFTLAGGAITRMSAVCGMVWNASFGLLGMLQCKSEEAATAALGIQRVHLRGQLAAEKGAARACLLGKLARTPSKGYPPAMPLDPTMVMWLEQFSTRASFGAHKASQRLGAVLPELLRHGATGTPADLEGSLEVEMLHLEKPRGMGGGVGGRGVVRIVVMTAKEIGSVPVLEEVIKGEVVENMTNEPGFVRATILRPTAAMPKTLRWVMEWASKAEMSAHVDYPHHRNTKIREIFHLVDMTGAGGALEYEETVSFVPGV